MDENHQDAREKKQVASEVKLWLPPSFSKNDGFVANGQKLARRDARKKGRIKWGFADKEVWDWFLLVSQVLGAIAIPFVILVAGLYFTQQITQQQAQLSEKQHQTDLQIAMNQQEEATLNTYLDDMTTLLLDKKLGSQAPADKVASAEAAVVARTKTLVALDRLDSRRKVIVLQFLLRAGLIDHEHCETSSCSIVEPVIDMRDANFNHADLRSINLGGASLAGASMVGTDLFGVFMQYVDLSSANLSGADLSGAIMYNANLETADLSFAHLNEAYVNGNDFGGTFLTGDNLFGANLRGAELINAVLFGADLTNADLSGAHLNGTLLSKANLTNASLRQANLSCFYSNGVQHNSRCTNLSSANLHQADLRGADLSQADLLLTNLSDALFSADTNLDGAYLSPSYPGAWPASLNCLYKCYQGDAHLYPNGLVEADLHGADLSEAYLNGVNLSKANLSGTDLSATHLNGADLSDANLSGADLNGADLPSANLSGANLSGADLFTAFVTTEQLVLAQSLQGATMPDGSKHP